MNLADDSRSPASTAIVAILLAYSYTNLHGSPLDQANPSPSAKNKMIFLFPRYRCLFCPENQLFEFEQRIDLVSDGFNAPGPS